MEPLEATGGIDPELLGEQIPCARVRGERVRLATGAVEREHQHAPEPFAQRIGRGQRLQLPDDLVVVTQGEIR